MNFKYLCVTFVLMRIGFIVKVFKFMKVRDWVFPSDARYPMNIQENIGSILGVPRLL